MVGRHEFLARVRDQLATSAPESLPHPLPPPGPVPLVRYEVALDDLVSTFMAKATAAGATCVRARTPPDRDAVVAEAVGASVTTAVVSDDAEARTVRGAIEQAGVTLVEWDRRSAATADIGITGAAYGIAATGSLVLDARRAGGRTAGLLPPRHVALVRADAILATAGDLFRRLGERFPEGLPSQLVLATGPSRSADIELQLTVGVHGPGSVLVVVLG